MAPDRLCIRAQRGSPPPRTAARRTCASAGRPAGSCRATATVPDRCNRHSGTVLPGFARRGTFPAPTARSCSESVRLCRGHSGSGRRSTRAARGRPVGRRLAMPGRRWSERRASNAGKNIRRGSCRAACRSAALRWCFPPRSITEAAVSPSADSLRSLCAPVARNQEFRPGILICGMATDHHPRRPPRRRRAPAVRRHRADSGHCRGGLRSPPPGTARWCTRSRPRGSLHSA